MQVTSIQNLKIMKKLLFSLSAFLFITCFFSCDDPELCPQITIPETDTIAPGFTFSINGAGIGKTIATHEGWTGGQLTLLAGASYKFVFAASDDGGTRLLRMQIPIDLTITQLSPENASIFDLGAFSKLLELTNNDDSPTTCLIMNGDFTTTDDTNIVANVGFFASDYGGTAGTRNSTDRSVTITFTDDLGEVGFFDF